MTFTEDKPSSLLRHIINHSSKFFIVKNYAIIFIILLIILSLSCGVLMILLKMFTGMKHCSLLFSAAILVEEVKRMDDYAYGAMTLNRMTPTLVALSIMTLNKTTIRCQQ